MMNNTFASPPLASTDRRISRPWWKRRPTVIAAASGIALTAVLALTVSMPASGTLQVSARSLDMAQVKRGPFLDFLPVRSEVIPDSNSFIAAEAAGRVLSVEASDGELVRKGQILAHLANPDVTLQVALQDIDISTNQSQINQQTIDLRKSQEQRERDITDTAYALHKAEQERDKKQFLRDANLINDVALKPFEDEVVYQQSRLKSLQTAQALERQLIEAQMKQIAKSAAELNATAERIHQGLNALLVIAPQDGRLSGFNLKPGQAVKVGDPLGEVDLEDSYKVKALVDEYYLSRLHVDLAGTALLHGNIIALKVSKIFPQVTEGRVTVELAFSGTMPSGLKRGEAVDVKLKLGDTKEALFVPAGGWLSETGGASIFVLSDKGDHAYRRTVTVGRRNPESVEITAGLKEGEKVVTNGARVTDQIQHLQISQGNKE